VPGTSAERLPLGERRSGDHEPKLTFASHHPPRNRLAPRHPVTIDVQREAKLMDPVVLLTAAQVEIYCNGLTDLVWEPPRANSCAHGEARDMLDRFKVARWSSARHVCPDETLVRRIAQSLSPKLDAWFDPKLWADVLRDVDASRAEILDGIESLRHAALDSLRH
jgi:hypothetical protein